MGGKGENLELGHQVLHPGSRREDEPLCPDRASLGLHLHPSIGKHRPPDAAAAAERKARACQRLEVITRSTLLTSPCPSLQQDTPSLPRPEFCRWLCGDALLLPFDGGVGPDLRSELLGHAHVGLDGDLALQEAALGLVQSLHCAQRSLSSPGVAQNTCGLCFIWGARHRQFVIE